MLDLGSASLIVYSRFMLVEDDLSSGLRMLELAKNESDAFQTLAFGMFWSIASQKWCILPNINRQQFLPIHAFLSGPQVVQGEFVCLSKEPCMGCTHPCNEDSTFMSGRESFSCACLCFENAGGV